MVGANVEGAGAEIEVARGGEVAGFFRVFGLREAAIAGRNPGFVERASVAIADGGTDGLDFCEFGATSSDVGERPTAEFIEQVVFKQETHVFPVRFSRVDPIEPSQRPFRKVIPSRK